MGKAKLKLNAEAAERRREEQRRSGEDGKHRLPGGVPVARHAGSRSCVDAPGLLVGGLRRRRDRSPRALKHIDRSEPRSMARRDGQCHPAAERARSLLRSRVSRSLRFVC